ncbi:cytochrome P450 [Mycobacterium sp. NPDC006124]|uniref:cytochrome P450 n=1 Tax=Mycobacterium sp. NPDC006124 TaxID=3156729 RepID=UPI0033AD1B6D
MTTTDATPGTLTPFWTGDVTTRLARFAAIRSRSGGVEFHDEGPGRSGFWSLTSHQAVSAVSRDPATFTSTKGFSLDDFPPEALEMMASIIAMDDPRHQRQRRLVQAAFSPRAIARLTDSVAALADQLVNDLRDTPQFDFVTAIAGNLPLQVICDLLEIPPADQPQLRDWVNTILGVDDPDFGGQAASLEALVHLYGYAIDLGQERLRHPGDDVTSALMHAEIDGVRLTPAEFGSFVVLLVAAGNDTTRTSLAWGMKLLSDHPEQKALLCNDFDAFSGNAVDEIIRWCSPALHMRRTATVDARIGDHLVAAGDKVVLWYLAANHDPAVFDDPDTFDVTRPNARNHIAFGAGGPHFCLGSHLAKMEVRVVLEKLLRAYPEIHTTAEPDVLVSPFVHGIKSLPCATG